LEKINEIFTEIIDNLKLYKIPGHRLFLGEFGCKRFAKGAENYLKDVLQIVKKFNLN